MQVYKSWVKRGGSYRHLVKRDLPLLLFLFFFILYIFVLWPAFTLIGTLIGILAVVGLLFFYFPIWGEIFFEISDDGKLTAKNRRVLKTLSKDEGDFVSVFNLGFSSGGSASQYLDAGFLQSSTSNILEVRIINSRSELEKFSRNNRIKFEWQSLLKDIVGLGKESFKWFFVCDDTRPVVEITFGKIKFTSFWGNKEYLGPKIYFSVQDPEKVLVLLNKDK